MGFNSSGSSSRNSSSASSTVAAKRAMSGPGVGWMLAGQRIRFSSDMTRVHRVSGAKENLLRLRFTDAAASRPSDDVLAALLRYLLLLPTDGGAVRHCLHLRETVDGWAMALEIKDRRRQPSRVYAPGWGPDSQMLALPFDSSNVEAARATAQSLHNAATHMLTSPDVPAPSAVISALLTT